MATFQLHSTKLKTVDTKIATLYQKYRDAIKGLDSGVEEVSLQNYIAFRKSKNFIAIEIQERSIKMTLNIKLGQIIDDKKLTKDVSQVKHHGNGDYQVKVSDSKNFEYILSLIKQAL